MKDGAVHELATVARKGWDVEMRKLVCRDLKELHQAFHLTVGRLCQKPRWVQAFVAPAGLKIEKT